MKKNISLGFFVMALFLFYATPSFSAFTIEFTSSSLAPRGFVASTNFYFDTSTGKVSSYNNVMTTGGDLNQTNRTYTIYDWTGGKHSVGTYEIIGGSYGAPTIYNINAGCINNQILSNTGICGCQNPLDTIIDGVCTPTCSAPNLLQNGECLPCSGQTVFLTDPNRCEPVLCVNGQVWDVSLKECVPPPDCDTLRNQCIGECVAVGQGDMDFTCAENAAGEQISTCNCIPPDTEYTKEVITPGDEPESPVPDPATPPPVSETPPPPDPLDSSPVLGNIATNIENLGNRIDLSNGYFKNMDKNIAKTVNNLNAININMGNLANKTNQLLTGISAKLTALNHQGTRPVPVDDPIPLTIGGTLTLPADNVYDTVIEPIPEAHDGLVTHLTNYIASGIPILSTIRNTKITASGSSIISSSFYGKPFYVDFAEWANQLHMAGIILVFGATVAAFYIVSGKS